VQSDRSSRCVWRGGATCKLVGSHVVRFVRRQRERNKRSWPKTCMASVQAFFLHACTLRERMQRTHTHAQICMAHTYTHLSHTWITTLAIAEPTTAVSSGLDAAAAASSLLGGGVVAGPSSTGGGGSAWSLMIDGGATAISNRKSSGYGKCWPARKTVVTTSCCMWWCDEKCRVIVSPIHFNCVRALSSPDPHYTVFSHEL
jgi:hypothetical protein